MVSIINIVALAGAKTCRTASLLQRSVITKRHHNILRFLGTYSIVKPVNITARRTVPDNILKPCYADTGKCPPAPKTIEIKTEEQIKHMRASCHLARKILNEVGSKIEVGISTDEIDQLVHNMAIEHGAYPSPLNYLGYPKSCCTSVNNISCHGIPDERPLADGDIVNLDITVYLNGYHGDCSATFLVGNVDRQGIKLVNITHETLEQAIAICRPGEYFSSIGELCEEIAKEHGYEIVPIFTGHGIGTLFHQPPDIYHCYNDYPGIMLPGMTFTVEPILSQGKGDCTILDDGWTAVTNDNSRTAQWEHTILITEGGAEILTV